MADLCGTETLSRQVLAFLLQFMYDVSSLLIINAKTKLVAAAIKLMF